MATLKSKKMVRGRDLKTPLAVSTMDKAKGGPGDPPKKKNVTKKSTGGQVKVRIARDPNRPNQLMNASFTQAEIDKNLASGKITKRKGGKGNVYIVTKKN
mgnify:CR=1 FL=1